MDKNSIKALNESSLEALITLNEALGLTYTIEDGKITSANINKEVQ